MTIKFIGLVYDIDQVEIFAAMLVIYQTEARSGKSHACTTANIIS